MHNVRPNPTGALGPVVIPNLRCENFSYQHRGGRHKQNNSLRRSLVSVPNLWNSKKIGRSFNLAYGGGPLALKFLAEILPNLKQSNTNAIYLTDIGHGIPT